MKRNNSPTACGIARMVRSGERSALCELEATLSYIEKHNGELNALAHVYPEYARKLAEQVDAAIGRGDDPGLLAGVPVVIKANIAAMGLSLDCCSKSLEGYISPYNSTVVDLMIKQGAVVVASANMDEFAMGSSTEHSCYGPARNPHNIRLTPGGSSGGSACAVASGMVPLALGSDTGGSVRQPASFCGVVGFKPSYGGVSRNGLVAFASSLDQISPLAGNVDDCRLLFDVIRGKDLRDSTTIEVNAPATGKKLRGAVFGIVKELRNIKGISEQVLGSFEQAQETIISAGGRVVEISVPWFDKALAAYHLLAMAEASSNLSRFDGVLYGRRAESDELGELYTKSRSSYLGTEVKRRILLGTFVLSSGYYERYYGSAVACAKEIRAQLETSFRQVNFIMTPTTPELPFELGAKVGDPVAMYMSDILTTPASVTGLPAISLPSGYVNGLPVGLQIMGAYNSDLEVLEVAREIEETLRVS